MPGRRLVEKEIGAGAGSVLLEGFLQEEKTYILTFSPTGPRVPQDIGQVSVQLTFLPFVMGMTVDSNRHIACAQNPKLIIEITAITILSLNS